MVEPVEASLRLKPQFLQRFFKIGIVIETPSFCSQSTTSFECGGSEEAVSLDFVSRSTAVRGILCRIIGKRISREKGIELVSASNLSYLGML